MQVVQIIENQDDGVAARCYLNSLDCRIDCRDGSIAVDSGCDRRGKHRAYHFQCVAQRTKLDTLPLVPFRMHYKGSRGMLARVELDFVEQTTLACTGCSAQPYGTRLSLQQGVEGIEQRLQLALASHKRDGATVDEFLDAE